MTKRALSACRLISVSLLLLCSCSTEVKFAAIDTSKPIEGVIYHLPSTEITFTSTYQLDTCGSAPEIRIVAVQIKEDIIADRDPSATYMLNHEGLTNWLKMVESAKVELHPTGTLKSVTYKAQDKTREIIKEGFGAAKNIALAASGIPPMPRAMADTGIGEYCNAATIDALVKKLTLETAIQQLKNRLDTELINFAANPNANGSQTIDLIHNQLDKASQRLAAVRSQLQISSSVTYLPHRSRLTSQIAPQPHHFFKWFGDNIIRAPSDIQQILTMTVTLARSGHGTFKSCPGTPNAGILYRIPDYYTMNIQHNGRTADIKDVPILQLGCVGRFEVKNGLFQNNVHEISFNGSGSLESFHFADNAARAHQLMGTINDVVSEAGSFESQRLSQQAELDKKKKERLDAEKERIRAERELAEERTKQN